LEEQVRRIRLERQIAEFVDNQEFRLAEVQQPILERGRDLVPAREVMLDEEARMEAQRLRLHVKVQIVAETLTGPRAKLATVGLRRTKETKTHESPSGQRMESADPSANCGDR
jgi:hypothetical protein